MTIETKANVLDGSALGITQTIVSDKLTQLFERRYQRVQRGTTSSKWLIANAREKANLDIQPNYKITSKDATWVKPPRPANCGAPIGNLVDVHLAQNAGSGHTAYFKGVQRCGSVWACPRCSAAKRSKYAIELDAAYNAIMESDDLNPGVFLTLTLRHTKKVPLLTSLSTLHGAFAKMRVQQGWRRLMDQLGKEALVRSTEITYSENNGWHPHLHIWLITNKPVDKTARAKAESEISSWWQTAVANYSGGADLVPDDYWGCDLRLVNSRGIAAYIHKIQDDKEPGNNLRLSSELVRADLKTARANSIVPFELLDRPDGKKLWLEYVETTKGRRVLDWTKGFKKRLGITKPKTKPQDLADNCQSQQSTKVFTIDGANYSQNRTNPDWIANVLTQTELNPIDAANQYGISPTVPLKSPPGESDGGKALKADSGQPARFNDLLRFWRLRLLTNKLPQLR